VADVVEAVSRNARLYRRLIGARIRSDLQYRTSLALLAAGTLLVTTMDFAMIAVIFVQVPALAGWSLAEVAFLYGTAGIAFGIADLFIGSVDKATERIRSGSFDIILLRPVGTLLQLITDEFALRRAARPLQPLVVLLVAMAALDVAWTPLRLAQIAIMIAGGTVIFSCIWVISAAATFWTVEGREAANAVTYGGGFLTQYPLPVYGEVVRSLAFVVPLAFVNYVPALAVLGKDDPLGVPTALQHTAPLVALVLVVISTATWRFAVRHYRSTGS
jgi:ABC-2 type transport system permease protein